MGNLSFSLAIRKYNLIIDNKVGFAELSVLHNSLEIQLENYYLQNL